MSHCGILSCLLSLIWNIQVFNLVLLFFVEVVLIFLQNLIERLSRLKENYFIIFFRYHWNTHLFLFGWFLLREVCIKFKLMSILQGSFVRALEVNRNDNWKLTIARIVYFKRCLVNSYKRLWKTLMNLKLYLFNKKTQVLLLHPVLHLAIFPDASYIAAPLINE